MLNPRLDLLSEYPFQRLAALLEGVSPGADPLVMSIGEPQHPVPALVAEVLTAHAAGWGKYPPIAGTPELRAAVAAWATRRYGLPAGMLDPETMVIPASGTREALYMINQVIVDERRAPAPLALMPNPFYQVYLGGALMAGAEPLLVDASATTGHLPDYAALPAEVWERAAVVTLCSPANPQGAVASLEEWKALITLARRHDVVVLADECYSEIYADTPPPGALEACAALGGSVDNVLVFNSLSKRSSVPGLRSGFVAGDPRLIDRFRRLRAYAAAGMPFPVQAASAALWSDETHAQENRRLYQEKVADAAAILGIEAPAGGFFLWLPVPDGEAFTRRLWAEEGVKVLPGAYLARSAADGSNVGAGTVRVALVHDRATTARALERIAACRHREGI